MSAPILLQMTCTELGLYRLDLFGRPPESQDHHVSTELAMAEALCAAVNAGVADEAVFQAINALIDVVDAPVEPRAARASG